MTTNVLLAGVGGQGIILASEVIAAAAAANGLDVKKSEVHGMAQRGGSVVTHVRFGDRVFSPLVAEGEAHFLVSFEAMETLRYLHYLGPGSRVVMNLQRIPTLRMLRGDERYPEIGEIAAAARESSLFTAVDADGLARAAGNQKAANIVLMGVLGQSLTLPKDSWHTAIRSQLPEKLHRVNLEAFDAGWNFEAENQQKTLDTPHRT
jgi:indolepyruvate ferredoxin oxidoreductase beta subunit